MAIIRKHIKTLVRWVLPVYLLVLANSIVNMHVHVLPDGVVVRHSHFYNHNSEDGKQHNHGEKEVSYYQSFFLGYFDNSEPVPEQKLFVSPALQTDGFIAKDYHTEQFHKLQLRGPPSLFFA